MASQDRLEKFVEPYLTVQSVVVAPIATLLVSQVSRMPPFFSDVKTTTVRLSGLR